MLLRIVFGEKDFTREINSSTINFQKFKMKSSRRSTIKSRPTLHSSSYSGITNDISKRLSSLEENLSLKCFENDILGRLRIIEDKLTFIEERFPQIASQYFVYSLMEGTKNQGRVSLIKSESSTIQNSLINESKAIKKSCQNFLTVLEKVKSINK